MGIHSLLFMVVRPPQKMRIEDLVAGDYSRENRRGVRQSKKPGHQGRAEDGIVAGYFFLVLP
jgi:hypothetical protein